MPTIEGGDYRAPLPARGGSEEPDSPLRASLDRLEQAVSAIHDSDTFRRFLDAQARFHRYSWGNVLLILDQRPDATRIASFRTWLSLGRPVRKGERGIRIFVPVWPRKPRDAEEKLDDSEQERNREQPRPLTRTNDRRPVSFKLGSVFDISQTDGPPLPRVEVPVLEGEEGRELFGHLKRVAELQEIEVLRTTADLHPMLGGGAMGYYVPEGRRIVLREAAPRQMAKTLAHELAHHFSGARSSSEHEETVAESVAYVACAHFGLDTGERSFPYVATWSREPSAFRAALARIQSLSALLIAEVEAATLDGSTGRKEPCPPPNA